MSTIKLAENVYSVGVINPTLRTFDIFMRAEYGTTYNAYLVTGEKNVLIDTVHEKFHDEYVKNVESIVPFDQIDYVVMNHTEPDHSGSLQRILQENPEITVIASTAATRFLKNLTNLDFNSRVVKEGDTLDLGFSELQFIPSMNLHWPDSMFTYLPARKIIFTCDFLGAHYCESQNLDTALLQPELYAECYRYYYDCIFGPFKPYVLAGLDKMEKLDIEMCCTSHGPILTTSLPDRMKEYREWSTPKAKADKPTVAIAYASAYCYTAKLAKAAADELKDDYHVELLDVVNADIAPIAEKVQEADAFMIGSCTINRDAVKPIWMLLASLDAVNTVGRPVGAFGSYGWSGEAVGMICGRLKDLKCKVTGEGFKTNFRPEDEDYAGIRAYAREVVAQLEQA